MVGHHCDGHIGELRMIAQALLLWVVGVLAGRMVLFGSGKSHLLKLLAFLSGNREVGGSLFLDLFLPKCADNEIPRGNLQRVIAR
jgi:hypothetical protein